MDNSDIAWVFKDIKGHQGPLRKTHPEYNESAYNVLVQWKDGPETYKPLDIIINDDTVSVASYAAETNIIDTTGWKRVKHIDKNQKTLQRMVNQARLCHIAGRNTKAIVYSFGI